MQVWLVSPRQRLLADAKAMGQLACIDYVIIHEVCHLKHPKLDRGFFDLLEQLVPDWRAIKSRLEVLP